LSVGQLCEKNYKVVFENQQCTIYDKNRGNRVVIVVAMSNNRMFPLMFGEHNNHLANMTYEEKSWLWHLKYGYLNFYLDKTSYFITFINDYSRKSWFYVLNTKDEALDKFNMFKSIVENERGC
jgi:hypothetical protein